MSAFSDRRLHRLALVGVLLAGLGLVIVALAGSGDPIRTPRPAAGETAGRTAVTDEVNTDAPLSFSRRPSRAPDQEPRTRGYVAATSPRSPAPAVSEVGPPTRIDVPALSVTAPVVPISTEGSTLVPPSDPTTIGWWSGGAAPGARTGTAVLTGHTVSTGGGAFDDLDLMRPGQKVRIRGGDQTLEYVVRSVTVYPKQTLAEHAAQLFDQSTRGRLALVTCEDWNGSVYLSNAVVIADRI